MTYDACAPYPRDLIGYGRSTPHPQWPGQARVAVQFVLNYEEGGENHILHGDPASEQFLSEMFNHIGSFKFAMNKYIKPDFFLKFNNFFDFTFYKFVIISL